MSEMQQLEKRRADILQEMDAIRSMLAATLKSQMLPVPHKGKKEPVMRGPYYVLAKWDPVRKRTHSRRVAKNELEQVQADVENHQRFLQLSAEFVALTEELGKRAREGAAHNEDLKKKPKSRRGNAKK